jgi:ABC-type Mn2+/Zn2+ transport system ATPase subunit
MTSPMTGRSTHNEGTAVNGTRAVKDASVSAGPLVEVRGVTVAYGAEPPVLVDANLVVRAGDFTATVGPSGSGKTTLLRVILGSVRTASGTVTRANRLRVGYVPQVETVDWAFPITVGECVLMARSAGRRAPWSTRSERAEVGALLERLGLGGLERRHIRALSGGQQQRVFIARALLDSPQLLLMDEPTSGVDVRTRHDVLHLLAELNAAGLAVVLTTHDLNGIAAHCRTLVCLNRQVIAQGSPGDVLTPDVLERTYGAPMEVLEHGGMPVVVDRPVSSNVIPLRRAQ